MRARLPWVEESVRQLAAAVGTELLASVEREDYRTRGLLFLR
jgi:hypothetical protein